MAMIFCTTGVFPQQTLFNNQSYCFGELLNKPNRQNEANMGIPVNEKCMLLRVGEGGNAYLDNIVGVVVIWKITAKREGEKWEET